MCYDVYYAGTGLKDGLVIHLQLGSVHTTGKVMDYGIIHHVHIQNIGSVRSDAEFEVTMGWSNECQTYVNI